MKNADIKKLAWDKMNGLIPAIIQREKTGDILMLGYMNLEALQKTLETNEVTFYSRSKKRLWVKGETSGNKLNLLRIAPDCDGDALLLFVEPMGVTCHKGSESCFEDQCKNDLSFLLTLSDLIAQRHRDKPAESYIPVAIEDARLGAEFRRDLNYFELENPKEYSLYFEGFPIQNNLKVDLKSDASSRIFNGDGYITRLFNAGVKRIAQKVGEEGVEVALAALSEDEGELCEEAADLLFHLLVLLEAKKISIHDVLEVLRKRNSLI